MGTFYRTNNDLFFELRKKTSYNEDLDPRIGNKRSEFSGLILEGYEYPFLLDAEEEAIKSILKNDSLIAYPIGRANKDFYIMKAKPKDRNCGILGTIYAKKSNAYKKFDLEEIGSNKCILENLVLLQFGKEIQELSNYMNYNGLKLIIYDKEFKQLDRMDGIYSPDGTFNNSLSLLQKHNIQYFSVIGDLLDIDTEILTSEDIKNYFQSKNLLKFRQKDILRTYQELKSLFNVTETENLLELDFDGQLEYLDKNDLILDVLGYMPKYEENSAIYEKLKNCISNTFYELNDKNLTKEELECFVSSPDIC